jgi:YYY domain-containing protein
MEAMMINAILRSPSFPPNDAWLAGYPLSYYYFGYLILAMLTLLSGVPAAVGFNLGGALIFALTVIGAFSLGYNLRASLSPKQPALRPALAAGLLTAAMLALMGNLGGVLGLLKCAHALPDAFWAWLDVRETATRSYACDGLIPREFYGWWWDWSRVVKDTTPDGRYQETITEVPIFSFVLGDNHPHVMGLPLAMLALSLAFAALRAGAGPFASAHSFVLTAIALGGLAFMNTWDWPIYSLIFVIASLLGSAQRWRALLWSASALALGYVLYLPWQVTFASQASGLGINLFNGTRLTHFGLLFAPFLAAGLGFLIWATQTVCAPAYMVIGRTAGLASLTLAAGIIGMATIGLLLPQGRALVEAWQTNGLVLGYPSALVTQRLIARATAPWTSALLAGIAAWCAVLLLNQLARQSIRHLLCPSDVFVLILLGAGALLTLAVEFVFLRDLFGTRMNTVFKFYYQAWTLWAIAGGYAIARILAAPGFIGRTLGTVALICVVLGMCYPPMAIYARSNGFRDAPTLDGAAYLKAQQPEDAALIAWLNANVQGAPRILEAPPDSAFGAYAYESRIATFTGLPTILGWGGHQHQWRGRTDIQTERFPLIEQLYNTTDPMEARALLRQFEIAYVVIGQVERARFAPDGLDKFEVLCAPAFRAGQSAVYHCP